MFSLQALLSFSLSLTLLYTVAWSLEHQAIEAVTVT